MKPILKVGDICPVLEKTLMIEIKLHFKKDKFELKETFNHEVKIFNYC